jgi:hypothetical protein
MSEKLSWKEFDGVEYVVYTQMYLLLASYVQKHERRINSMLFLPKRKARARKRENIM